MFSIPPHLVPLLGVAALVLLSLYRRIRRNIGLQPIRPRRMAFRIVLLCVAAGALLFQQSATLTGQACEGAGLVIGFAVAVVGIRLTRFSRTPEGDFYTPNPWLGTAVSLLFIGRMLYRMVTLYSVAGQSRGMDFLSNPAVFYGSSKSFLTLALFGVVVGYYVAYTVGVLLMHRRRNLPTSPDVPPPDARAQAGDPI